MEAELSTGILEKHIKQTGFINQKNHKKLRGHYMHTYMKTVRQ